MAGCSKDPSAGFTLGAAGLLETAQSGSSTWIWKTGCLEVFSAQLLLKSSFLQVGWDEPPWRDEDTDY